MTATTDDPGGGGAAPNASPPAAPPPEANAPPAPEASSDAAAGSGAENEAMKPSQSTTETPKWIWNPITIEQLAASAGVGFTMGEAGAGVTAKEKPAGGPQGANASQPRKIMRAGKMYQPISTDQIEWRNKLDVNNGTRTRPTPPPAAKEPAPAPAQEAKGGKKQRTWSGKTKKTEPAAKVHATQEEAENVWNKAQEVLIKGKVKAIAAAAAPSDEKEHEVSYAIAKADYRTVPDGYQRPMTELEKVTLFEWRTKVIHLQEPPRFIHETFTLKERLTLRQIHQEAMGYKVYVVTPPKLKWPPATVKYHFCETLLRMNQEDGTPSDRVLQLLNDVHVFTCSAESKLAVMRFVRPDVRDKWVNQKFKFPFGTIHLRATDDLDQEDKSHGLDEEAMKMLYQIHLLGKPSLAITDIMAIATELSGGLPILDIVPVEPTGVRALETHVWNIKLNSVTGPPAIANVRRLKVTQGDLQFTIGVHQPRLAKMHPCPNCLGIDHYRNRCPNKEKEAEHAAPFEQEMSIPPTAGYDAGPMATDLDAYMGQLLKMRETLAPDLLPKEEPVPQPPAQDEKKDQQPPARTNAPPSQQPRKTTVSGEQLRAITKAIGQAKDKRQKKMKKRAGASEKLQNKEAKPTVPLFNTAGKIFDAENILKFPKFELLKKNDGDECMDEEERRQATAAWKEIVIGSFKWQKGALSGEKRDRDEAAASDQEPSQVMAICSAGAEEVETKEPDEEPSVQPELELEAEHDRRRLKQTKPGQDKYKPNSKDKPEVETESKPKAQMTITQAFPPKEAGSEEGEDQTKAESQSVEFVRVLKGTPPDFKYGAVLSSIEATEVKTPMNGWCGYHALVAAKSRACGPSIDGTDATEVARAKDLQKGLSEYLRDELPGMVADGTITLRELCNSHLNLAEAAEDSMEQLQKHFDETSKLPSDKPIGRKHWAGAVEILAYVRWAEEPVYVFDVWPSGTAYVQRYAPIWTRDDAGRATVSAARQAPSIAHFRAQIAVYKRNQVIPLMMILHHQFDGTTLCGHFNAARLAGKLYRDWAGSVPKQEKMKERLYRVLSEIDDLISDGTPTAPTPSAPVWPPDSSSEYTPSGSSADSTDVDERRKAGQPAPKRAGATVQAAQSTTTLSQVLGPEEDAESVASILSSQLDSQPEPTFWHPASFATPASQLDAKEEAVLIDALAVKPPLPDGPARSLKKAKAANSTAFLGWQNKQRASHPATYKLVQGKTVVEACATLSVNPAAMRGLVRSVPFPEVLIALLPVHTLVDVGKQLICEARIQMLLRLEATMPPLIGRLCSAWRVAIAETKNLAAKYTLANDLRRWRNLDKGITKAKRQAMLHRPTPTGVSDDAWARFIAYLLLVPGCLPVDFTSRDLRQQGDALLAWAAQVTNVKVTATAAHAIQRREWKAVDAVRLHWNRDPTEEEAKNAVDSARSVAAGGSGAEGEGTNADGGRESTAADGDGEGDGDGGSSGGSATVSADGDSDGSSAGTSPSPRN